MTAGRRWAAALGLALTLAMVAGLAGQLLGGGLATLRGAMPAEPGFYAAVLLLYLVPPLADVAIFRRLWGMPAGAGLAAAVRKRIANEVVLGYSGEAYFYAWARARGIAAAPFAAIKDVGILSALAGNAATLVAVAAALPFASGIGGREAGLLAGSAAVLVGMTLPFLLWRARVFSLDRAGLRWVFAVHLGRIALTTLLVALAWRAAVPGIALATALLLAAGRLLVSRLPFVPNKELLFANLAILWLGDAAALSGAVAIVAALTLAAHVVLMAGFGGRRLLSLARR